MEMILGVTCGVRYIVGENQHDDSRSSPGRGCLHFIEKSLNLLN